MISATPNSVRWDQVNRVTYRFQALNFQSDVLEALVLNSPPLSRKNRRKPIIRVCKSDSAGNKVEFLKARSLQRRSLSFDDGISENPKNDVKFNEKSRVSHDRYASGRAEVNRLVFEPKRRVVFARSDTDSIKSSSSDVTSERSQEAFDCEEAARLNSDVAQARSLDENERDESTEDLEGKSRQYLIELVKELRNQVKELRLRDKDPIQHVAHNDETSPRKTNDLKTEGISSHACCRCAADDAVSEPAGELALKLEDGLHKDPLASHMQQLESEVLRTRKIATMFEDEITELKEKFSGILTRANKAVRNTPLLLNGDQHALQQVNDQVTRCSQNSQVKVHEENTLYIPYDDSLKKLPTNLDSVSIVR